MYIEFVFLWSTGSQGGQVSYAQEFHAANLGSISARGNLLIFRGHISKYLKKSLKYKTILILSELKKFSQNGQL